MNGLQKILPPNPLDSKETIYVGWTVLGNKFVRVARSNYVKTTNFKY